MNLAIDAVGNKSGGGAIILLQLLQAASAANAIRQITVFVSPASCRQFGLPLSHKISIVEVVWAETSIGRFLWGLKGISRRLSASRHDAFLGLNGIGSVPSSCVSLLFIQQSLPFCKEALRRFPPTQRARMATIFRLTRRSARMALHIGVQTVAMRETVALAFGLPRDRISVFSPDCPDLSKVREDLSLGLLGMKNSLRPALFYVGSALPHKNLGVVLQALDRFSEEERPDFYVTLPPNASRICQHPSVKPLGHLDRSELFHAYSLSAAVIMPSLVETVGLPLLEAFSIGVPVIAADRPYAREICEDAALFFDPLSPEDLAARIRQILSHKEVCTDLVRRGRLIATRRAKFDPYKRMIEKVVELSESSHHERC